MPRSLFPYTLMNKKSVSEGNAVDDICVLIPAFNPDERLLQLIESLIESGFSDIIVVDDGSSEQSAHNFERIEKIDQCHLLRHAVNLGKGRALKTGLNYYLLSFPDSDGIVTADADGQHIQEDILKVARSLKANQHAMILGSRSFDKSSPLRSLIGNLVTRVLFSFLVGMKVSDTQTGLRGIPKEYVPYILQLDGERYEYETNMLIAMKERNIRLKEEKIKAIYIDNNKSSHFNPIFDSMKIYFLLLRFSFSSAFAASMDFIVFTLTYSFVTKNILFSIVMGRVVASIINFTVNRRLVFHHSEPILAAIIKYYVLTAIIMLLAYSLIIMLVSDFGINVILSKILAETVLFMASFSIQRDFIFRNGGRSQSMHKS